MFRVAHISDTHVLSPGGVEWRAILFNKRITGCLNLLRGRSRVYRRAYLDLLLEAAPREADHLVVGASGAALDHPDRAVRAGLNVYDIGADGAIERIESLVVDPAGSALNPVPIPLQAASP